MSTETRLVWSLLLVSACQPSFDDRASLITSPRILAVRADPPESAIGQTITYEALVASPEGVGVSTSLNWSFCAAPKPLTENDSVSAECLADNLDILPEHHATITTATPQNACQFFGPDTPPGNFRPRDADETGGFYQPLRIDALGQTTFAFERITCNLSNAPLDVSVAYANQYIPNQNPHLQQLAVSVSGIAQSLDNALPAGSDAQFEVHWNAEDAESFISFDPQAQSLQQHRESLRISWYATAGEFESDVTGRDENDETLSTTNKWRVPDKPGTVFLWLVLRDSRGGMDMATYSIQVH